jgi:hypothetical protein
MRKIEPKAWNWKRGEAGDEKLEVEMSVYLFFFSFESLF